MDQYHPRGGIGPRSYRPFTVKEQELAEAKYYALSCAKAAYLCYKDNIAYDSYPYILQRFNPSGGNVGHQQHSRAFISKFLPMVSNVIRETICDDVKRKPFGITADKITTLNRTRHIFGLRISQLSNMTTEKCAEDVYLSHSIVFDVTSKGLAKHLIQCLEMLGLSKMQIRAYLIGMAFDGQYVKMGVDKEVCKELNVEKQIPNTWDPIHLLEISQEDSETIFVTSTCKTINAVMKVLKWGKSVEILLFF